MSGDFSVNVGQVFDGYQVVAEIGSGAMGRVYEVLDLKLDVHRAVKFFCPRYDGDTTFLKERFFGEARLLCSAGEKCRNLVRIHSLNEEGSNGMPPYFVMDCVKSPDGEVRTLKNVFENPEYNTPENQFKWFVDIAHALQDLHREGIVHRDVKPSNILINKDGHAMLSDFGIAKIAGRKEDGDFCWDKNSLCLFSKEGWGTPGYTAPEMGDPDAGITPAVDVYSLGATFLEFVCDEEAKVNRDYSELLEGFDGRWGEVLPAMLEAKTSKRIDLDTCLSIIAGKNKNGLRKRLLVAAATLFVISLGVFGAWVVSQMPDARDPSTVDAAERFESGMMFSRRTLFKKGNGEKAYEWVLSAANDDYVPAQREMAFLYKEGVLGPDPDQIEAFRWFKRAADNGDAESQYETARYYIEGRPGEAPSDELALPYLMSASSNGIAEAQCDLARFYRDGLGGLSTNLEMAVSFYQKSAAADCVEAIEDLALLWGGRIDPEYFNPNTAIDSLFAAAELGSAYAMTEIGLIYALGWPDCDIRRDENVAVEWFKQAIDSDDERPHAVAAKDMAHSYMGYYYLKGEGVSKNIEKAKREFALSGNPYSRQIMARLLLSSEDAGEQVEGLEQLRELAEAGDSVAMCDVAWCHQTGRAGLPKNPYKAYELYKEASAQSNCCAMARCGNMEQFGIGVHHANPTNAVDLYKMAAELGCPEGCYYLANAYARGIGGLSVDARKAFDFYRLAAESGLAEAEFEVGNYYLYGKGGVTKSVDTARAWFDRASRSGFGRALGQLAFMELYGVGQSVDTHKALELAKAAVDKKDPLGKFVLAAHIDRTSAGERRIDVLRILAEAAAENDIMSNIYLGRYYFREAEAGRSRYDNADKAFGYLTRAMQLGVRSDKGLANTIGEKGYLLLKDWGSYSPDPVAGLGLLKEAAENGDPWSCYIYGVILFNGSYGCNADKVLAVKYLKKSSAAHHPAGDYNYALVLYKGEGGESTNTVKAAYLMKRAARNGSVKAQQFLVKYGIK